MSLLDLNPAHYAWLGAAALVVGLVGGAGGYQLRDTIARREVAELKLTAANADAAQARAALDTLQSDMEQIHASAVTASATIDQAVAAIPKEWKKNAIPLIAGCHPDADRVSNLSDSIDTVNQAISGK